VSPANGQDSAPTNEPARPASTHQVAGLRRNARQPPSERRWSTRSAPTIPNSPPEAPVATASWPTSESAEPAIALIVKRARNRAGPTVASSMGPATRSPTTFRARCAQCPCTNAADRSRQAWPAQTRLRSSAPAETSLAAVTGPRETTQANTAAFAPTSASVTGEREARRGAGAGIVVRGGATLEA